MLPRLHPVLIVTGKGGISLEEINSHEVNRAIPVTFQGCSDLESAILVKVQSAMVLYIAVFVVQKEFMGHEPSLSTLVRLARSIVNQMPRWSVSQG